MLKPLLLAALVLLPAMPSRDAAYDGRWVLDKARSTDLPPFYATVKSHRLAVADSAGRLVVNVEIDAGRAAPDRFRFEYPFDGTSETTTRVRTPDGPVDVPTTLSATRAAGGALRLTIARHPDFGGEQRTFTGTEEWSLSPDGKTLTIARRDELPQGGEFRATMVFARE